MANETDYIELGLACADICTALGRGMNGKRLGNLSQSVCDAIAQLTTCVKPMQRCTAWNDSMTKFLIVGPWRRSKGESSNRAGGTLSLDFSMRRVTEKLLQPGN